MTISIPVGGWSSKIDFWMRPAPAPLGQRRLRFIFLSIRNGVPAIGQQKPCNGCMMGGMILSRKSNGRPWCKVSGRVPVRMYHV